VNPPAKLLLMEGRPADARLLLQGLREAGYAPTARCVDREQDFIAALDPGLDVILTDYVVPGWSGEAAITAVQAAKLDVPIIVVSGIIGDESAAAVMRLGAVDFLLKDRLARLGSAVARALSERALRREARAAQEALRSAHAQLAQLLGHSPAVLFQLKISDNRFVPLVASEGVTRLLGFSTAETLDFKWWQARLHPEDRKVALASMPATLARGSSRTEYRLRHKAGHYCWVEDVRRLVHDEEGRAVEVAGAWIDITDRKQAEAERQRLAGELDTARTQVRVLSGLLPICASCKNIRDDAGRWHGLEQYIQSRTEAQFTHGLCPKCVKKLYPDLSVSTS